MRVLVVEGSAWVRVNRRRDRMRDKMREGGMGYSDFDDLGDRIIINYLWG